MYTGVIYINTTISFYGYEHLEEPPSPSSPQRLRTNLAVVTDKRSDFLKTGLPLPSSPPLTVPFGNAPLGGIWGPMTVSGERSIHYNVSWPQTNIARGYIDVYASAHQCEEFWYTNLPDDHAEEWDFCGGGAYREIQAHIGDLLAGAVYPFTVLYTGGVNPLLWRPLTGIMSFDIPAYRCVSSNLNLCV